MKRIGKGLRRRLRIILTLSILATFLFAGGSQSEAASGTWRKDSKGNGWANVVRLNKGKFTSLGSGGFEYPYFDPDFDWEEWKYTYTWNGETVTKKQYESSINKLYKNRKGSLSFGRGSLGKSKSYNGIMKELNTILK